MLALRPYQQQMIDFVVAKSRCNLFARMGAGKTVSVLTALNSLDLAERVFPVLIIAPKRVAVSTWPAEVEKWAHLRHLKVRVISGTAKERTQAALTGGADVYTIAYDNLQWLMLTLGERWYWPTVVCDESTRLKGFRLRQGSKRAQALAKVAHRRVERWINLAGLPAPNGYEDLWGQQWFVDRGERLGKSFSAYTSLYFTQGMDMQLRLQRGCDIEIKEKMKDVSLAIDPRKYLNVKEPNRVRVEVELPKAAMAQYKVLKKAALLSIEGIKLDAGSAATLSMKLRQLAGGAVYRNDDDAQSGEWIEVHDGKLDALDSIVAEQGGAPLLVAYYFKSDLARLKKRFPQARELDANPKTIDAWNRGEIPILLAHPKSAGHGLNLQDGGCDIAYFTFDWNMEEMTQILERIGPTRQAQAGHDRVVNVFDIVAKGTTDDIILARLAGKTDINEGLLNHLLDD